MRSLFLLTLLASPFYQRAIAAPTLHTFFVVDTAAKNVGLGCLQSYRTLQKILDEIFDDRAETHKAHYFSGNRVGPSNVIGFIEQQTNIGSDDTVWFYYCGHGATDKEAGHFLATSEGDIKRSDLRVALQNTGARLVVITTEACSSPATFEFLPRRVSPATWTVFNQLFFHHRGITDITAATTPQFAWLDDSAGGFFSRSLIRLLCEKHDSIDSNGDGFATWSEGFSYISRETQQTFTDARLSAVQDSPTDPITQSKEQVPYRFSLATPDQAAEGTLQYGKTIRPTNNTPNTLNLSLRAFAYDKDAGWRWVPGVDQSYTFTLAPGQSGILRHEGKPLYASKMIAWGSSGSAKFSKATYNLASPQGYRSEQPLAFKESFYSNDDKITKVAPSTTHNVYRGGEPGVLIRIGFTTHYLKGETAQWNALFFHKNGAAVVDGDGRYSTPERKVGVAARFQPKYLHSTYATKDDDGVELFMPYSQLHLGQTSSEVYFKLHASYGGKGIFSGTNKTSFNYSPGTE